MAKCLFIIPDWPISPNAAGGAPALFYSHLALLANSVSEIHLLVLHQHPNPGQFEDYQRIQPDIWEQVQAWVKSIETLRVTPIQSEDYGLNRLARLSQYITNSVQRFSAESLQEYQTLLSRLRPDFIWAEHYLAAVFASAAAPDELIIYSHHDWNWRIKQLRSPEKARSLRGKLRYMLVRRQEEQLVRSVAGCVSASITEIEDIRDLGQAHVAYFPATYDPVALTLSQVPDEMPRIVHIGGMGTTANRVGLERFLEVTWPLLRDRVTPMPELWVIGSLAGASDTLLAQLTKVGAVRTGFVEDLHTVLRPYDIHIVPWEHNTGTRTRVPLVLSYGQVLVSTRAGSAGLLELEHGTNCLLVDDLEQMAEAIDQLLTDDQLRRHLALTGHQTFLDSFTLAALQPRFNDFLAKLR